MKKFSWGIRASLSPRVICLPFACMLLLLVVALSAQAPKTGVVRLLADVKFPPGDGPDCLQFVLENGDLKTGPNDRDHESGDEMRRSPALSHCGGAVDHRERKRLDGNGRNGGYGARSGGLCDDAQQAAALVHVHGAGRMPDVRNVRSDV